MRVLEMVDQAGRQVLSRAYAALHQDAVTRLPEAAMADRDIAAHWRAELPLLLEGGARHWPAVGRWSPAYLAERVHGSIGVGCSRSGVFKTRTTAIVRMSVREALDTIAVSADPEKRYYLKNVPLRGSCFEAVADEVGTMRLLPRDAVDVGGGGPPGALFWMGQRGTITPLHADPTPNVIATIIGTKLVTLISPAWSPWLYPEPVSSAAFWYSRVGNVHAVDRARFPAAAGVRLHRVRLTAGDALFIPAGWWHQVENVEVAASINCFFRSATAWGAVRRTLNPHVWHCRLARLVDDWRVARFLRYGGTAAEAERFDVYVKMLSPEALRVAFAGYKRSRHPLYRWALAPYADLEASPLWRRYLELQREAADGADR